MTLPRSVADVLSHHVTLEVEGIDRMYLNVYQPRPQTDRGVAAFVCFHRRETFASSILMDPISKSFIAAVERFVGHEQIPLITGLLSDVVDGKASGGGLLPDTVHEDGALDDFGQERRTVQRPPPL